MRRKLEFLSDLDIGMQLVKDILSARINSSICVIMITRYLNSIALQNCIELMIARYLNWITRINATMTLVGYY